MILYWGSQLPQKRSTGWVFLSHLSWVFDKALCLYLLMYIFGNNFFKCFNIEISMQDLTWHIPENLGNIRIPCVHARECLLVMTLNSHQIDFRALDQHLVWWLCHAKVHPHLIQAVIRYLITVTIIQNSESEFFPEMSSTSFLFHHKWLSFRLGKRSGK